MNARAWSSLTLLTAVLASGCSDLFVDPAANGEADVAIAFSLVSAAGSDAAAFDKADAVRIQLLRSNGSAAVDETVPLTGSGGLREATVAVNLAAETETLSLLAALTSGSAALFTGSTGVSLTRGQTAAVELELAPVVAAIELPQVYATLTGLGQELILSGTALFATGDTVRAPVLMWSTLDPNILAVSPNGRAVAVGTGEARVTAQAGNASATTRVRVEAPTVATITINPPGADLVVGETIQLTATLRDASGQVIQRPLFWTSSDQSIASIDVTGFVTAVSPGVAIIEATSEGVSAEATITVTLQTLLGPTISNPRFAVTGLNQCTLYDVNGNPRTGSIFQFSFDYTDANNAMTTGAGVYGTWTFSPSGNWGDFGPFPISVTGLGSGTGTFLLCFFFASDASVQLDFFIANALGYRGNDLSLTIQRPVGAQEPPPAAAAGGSAPSPRAMIGRIERD